MAEPTANVSARSHRRGLRAVATLEAFKGAVALAAGFGLLALLGRDAEHIATQIVHRLHLNPASHYPHIFIEAMARVSDTHLLLIAAGTALYSLIRFVEAYGLWQQRRWAEWLAAVSGGIYIPLEIYELVVRVTIIRVGALVINLAVVAYMVWLLTERLRLRRQSAK